MNIPSANTIPPEIQLFTRQIFWINVFRKNALLHFFGKNWKNSQGSTNCLHSEVLDIPIYKYENGENPLCITMPFSTAPGAAGTIEELHAMGCETFVVCGAAGALTQGSTLGEIILPASAIRDEGTSFHYIAPSREISCHKEALEKAQRALSEMGVPFVLGKTWTTDAMYRETPEMIARRRDEGCVTVEMETAAFFAVSP